LGVPGVLLLLGDPLRGEDDIDTGPIGRCFKLIVVEAGEPESRGEELVAVLLLPLLLLKL
jgi:hypothetical protein